MGVKNMQQRWVKETEEGESILKRTVTSKELLNNKYKEEKDGVNIFPK